MKQIKYKDGHWHTVDHRDVLTTWTGVNLFSCEKVSDWRDIESGVWNKETGLFDITLKPEVPSLVEAAEACLQGYWPEATDWIRKGHLSYSEVLTDLVQALDREKSRPQPKYSDEAVEEFLDAAKDCEYQLQRLAKYDPCDWAMPVNSRAAKALHALIAQRDAK